MQQVYVGMSGGVDSSVAAALLQQQGYQVTGVYMKNWTQDLPGMKCPWVDDLADAKRVAVQLGIPFTVFDFEKEYKQLVVDYMIEEYQAGRTPNPDVMCNQEVKFGLFLRAALAEGADLVATGHYARVAKSNNESVAGPEPCLWHGEFSSLGRAANAFAASKSVVTGGPSYRARKAARVGFPPAVPPATDFGAVPLKMKTALLMGKDKDKDQSYFLYRVTEAALEKTLMPLGELTKVEVRQKAKELGLVTAAKKDSQGICFVGKVGIKEFLQQYVTAEPGDIIDKKTGHVLGRHDGAIFYTFGQRHGLNVGGGLPYYVVGKDMAHNVVIVTTDLNDETLWLDTVMLDQLHWNQAPDEVHQYQVRLRYRAPLIACQLKFVEGKLQLQLEEPERAVTPGQSAVLYEGERVVGGGIVM